MQIVWAKMSAFLYNLVLPEPETLKYSPGYLVHEYQTPRYVSRHLLGYPARPHPVLPINHDQGVAKQYEYRRQRGGSNYGGLLVSVRDDH